MIIDKNTYKTLAEYKMNKNMGFQYLHIKDNDFITAPNSSILEYRDKSYLYIPEHSDPPIPI